MSIIDSIGSAVFGSNADRDPTYNQSIIMTDPGKKGYQNWSFKQYGNTIGDGNAVPQEYLITITSVRNRCSIIGVIQDDIKMRVESQWDVIIPAGTMSVANEYTQLITTALGKTRAVLPQFCTRRYWVGTSPLQLSLNLRFEAVHDASIEVVKACHQLQSLACPSYSAILNKDTAASIASSAESAISKVWGGLGKGVGGLINGTTAAINNAVGLTPPGPSPFISYDEIKKVTSGQSVSSIPDPSSPPDKLKGGDYIIVEIGRLLTLFNVIVKDVDITYPPRMTSQGDTISAIATVNFETYEMPTMEDLDTMYSVGQTFSWTAPGTTLPSAGPNAINPFVSRTA
jgi:hypothetical protein